MGAGFHRKRRLEFLRAVKAPTPFYSWRGGGTPSQQIAPHQHLSPCGWRGDILLRRGDRLRHYDLADPPKPQWREGEGSPLGITTMELLRENPATISAYGSAPHHPRARRSSFISSGLTTFGAQGP